jgi:hypothetical protein
VQSVDGKTEVDTAAKAQAVKTEPASGIPIGAIREADSTSAP